MTLGRPEQLLVALLIEAAVGYPGAAYARIGHPVTWVGALITALELRWNRGPWRRTAGVALILLVAGIVIAAGIAIESLAPAVIVMLFATTGLAQRSLHDHVRRVAAPLARADLPAARIAVAQIVGRDTQALDEAGVATASIESLAESFCDGIVAPAFWFLVAGLPGLAACKAINTADSMIGHRDDRYDRFGWAAARADDVMNFIPARIAGLLVCLAGRGGWAMMLRDAGRHASPNGGWPEAAMAGALGRQLGGAVSYDGEPAQRALLGTGPQPDARDLTRALRIYRIACLLLWLVVGVVAWVR